MLIIFMNIEPLIDYDIVCMIMILSVWVIRFIVVTKCCIVVWLSVCVSHKIDTKKCRHCWPVVSRALTDKTRRVIKVCNENKSPMISI